MTPYGIHTPIHSPPAHDVWTGDAVAGGADLTMRYVGGRIKMQFYSLAR